MNAPLRHPVGADQAQRGYMSGFANEFATEALPGALPEGRNSPQRVAYGLYAEQISGTAFTAPRSHNRRSWLYRIRPGAVHQPFTPLTPRALHGAPRLVADFGAVPPTPPNQLRWDPLPMPTEPTDFIDGWVTMAGNGSAASMSGSTGPPASMKNAGPPWPSASR